MATMTTTDGVCIHDKCMSKSELVRQHRHYLTVIMFDKGGKKKGNKIKGLSQDSNQQLWSVECTHKSLIQQSLTSWSILKCLITHCIL